MAQQPSKPSQAKDSPTRAPESGEPTERPAHSSSSAKPGTSDKAKPGEPKIGQDLESGRQDAKP
jgi:hypothetical protein